ncbi:Transposon protein, putative, Mutator sub-class, expressed [Quillaja saponaria]|uniref:Transposon protein, putative, Mutator sub-class, expressed n=1 Tax=Quillaja saponaria TaxID=32244 RepID=A0AAD7LHE9_QUISA|nr:Transposon protein, putative, Mutator sub-class, expressed [Quillaja saponaria]
MSRVQSHDTLDPNPENIFMESPTSRRQYDQLSSHVAGEASASLRPYSPITYSEAPGEDIGDGEYIPDLNIDLHFNIEVDDDDIIEAPEEDLFAEYLLRRRTQIVGDGFLSLIRMHVTQRVGICLISDRHAGIIAAASDPRNGWTEPYGYHRFCVRHIASNFHKTHKNMKAKNLLIHTASQTQKRKFDKYFKKFVQLDSEYAAWIGRIPLEQWALAHDGGHRFDFMTTNLGECMNNVLKGARQVPITALVRLTFYRCVKYFVEHRAYINAQLGAGNQYTTDTIEKIQNWAERAGGHELRQFHTGLGIIEIKTQFRGW